MDRCDDIVVSIDNSTLLDDCGSGASTPPIENGNENIENENNLVGMYLSCVLWINCEILWFYNILFLFVNK